MGEFVIAVALLPLSLKVTLNWLFSAVQGPFFAQLHGTGHVIHVKKHRSQKNRKTQKNPEQNYSLSKHRLDNAHPFGVEFAPTHRINARDHSAGIGLFALLIDDL